MGIFDFFKGNKKEKGNSAKEEPAKEKTENFVEKKVCYYINSKGNTYYLHTKNVVRDGKNQTMYYFKQDATPYVCEKPPGKTAIENTRSGIPFLGDTSMIKNPENENENTGHILVKIDVENGHWKLYYKNGELKQEGVYNNDGMDDSSSYKKEGPWKYYHENGQLLQEGNYKDGEETCKWVGYYENGQIEQEGDFKKGRRDGSWKYYYAKGELKQEGKYKDGYKNGQWKYYYTNGELKKEGNYYKSGYENGHWKYYHENGKLEIEEIFENGEKVNIKFYHEDGKIEQEQIFENGEKVNIKFYHEDGKIEQEQIFENGEKVNIKFYHEDGKIEIEQIFENGEQINIKWYDGGNLSKEGVYNDDDQKVGFWKFYHENGKLENEGNYKNDVENGPWKYYYENGKLEKEGNYKAGNKDGLWTTYKVGKNGVIWKHHEETYNDGTRIAAKDKYYYETGELKSQEIEIENIRLEEYFYKNGERKQLLHSYWDEEDFSLIFDLEGNEVSILSNIPHNSDDTEKILREKLKLKKPDEYDKELYFFIKKVKVEPSKKIYDEDLEEWVKNPLKDYCVLCRIYPFLTKNEFDENKNDLPNYTYGEFYLNKKQEYLKWVDIPKTIKHNIYSNKEEFVEDYTNPEFKEIKAEFFEGKLNDFKNSLKEKFGNNIEINLIKNGIPIINKNDKKLFHYANLSFEYKYYKAVKYIDSDYIEHDPNDDSYTIQENPYTGDEIINSLFPGKYIALSYYVYYGTFEFEGEEVEDVAEYSDGNDSIYYVGGAHNEDRTKEIDYDTFSDLNENYLIEQDPKHQTLEFIDSKNYKSLRESHKKELEEVKANHGPYDLPEWVNNPYKIMSEYNLDISYEIQLGGPKDNKVIGIFYKLIGAEVFMYHYIFDQEEKIKKNIKFSSFNLLQSLRNEGYDKFELPEYNHHKDKEDKIPFWSVGVPSKEEEEVFESLGKKYKKDPSMLRYFAKHKDFLLPDNQDFVQDNYSNGITDIKNSLKWFKQNNIPLYKIIVNELYAEATSALGHLIPCLWNIYPGIIYKDDDMYLTEDEIKNTKNLTTKEFDSNELYQKFIEEKICKEDQNMPTNQHVKIMNRSQKRHFFRSKREEEGKP